MTEMPDTDLDKIRHQYKMTERLGKNEPPKKGDRQGFILEWINR